MRLIRTPLPVKLFIGMISPDPALFSDCREILCAAFGPTDLESKAIPWDVTDYYRKEMGSSLLRKFLFFRELIDPGKLPQVKRFTCGIEAKFAVISGSGPRRRINLDPGYLTEAKVILATTKDFAHRCYIGENIFAEVTLQFSNRERSFISLDHTYFDFRSEGYKCLFNTARGMLREKISGLKKRD